MVTIIKKYKFALFIFTFFFIFSLCLFFYTFFVDSTGNINIASKLWSDFGSTFPIIRSFSKGSNFPPEYPIFSGPPIRYHFGFYAIVGLLEKFGLRIDFALNTLSALSLSGLFTSIYLLTFSVFKKHSVAAVAVILSIFNGSLGFVEYFKTNPPSLSTLQKIITNHNFSSFGPYDGKIISAFWNLNIYTNQRHLALAYATFIFVLLLLYHFSKKQKGISLNKAMVLGLIIGVFPFIHMAVFGMLIILLGSSFLLYPNLRIKIIITLFVATTIAFPLIVYMGPSQVKIPLTHFGYLAGNLTFKNFITYWLFNLGLNSILPFVGFVLAKKDQRKILIPFILLFLIANVFRFSPEIAANHKFINLYFIGSVMFSAFALVQIWNIKVIGKLIIPTLLVFSTLSGIIDFFPIINDSHLIVTDIKNDETTTFIIQNTDKKAVFLNTKFLYDPAMVAGRKVYLGWPYFSWSAGYDTDSRFKKLKEILASENKNVLCDLMLQEKIDYIELENPSELANEGVVVNYSLFEQELKPVFTSKTSISIFQTKKICAKN